MSAHERARAIPCSLCGSDASQVVSAGLRDHLAGTPGTWQIVRCAKCDHRYLSPSPQLDDLGELYPARYGSWKDPDALGGRGLRTALRRAIAWPYRLRYGEPTDTFAPEGDGRLLDVGCGTGGYLRRMAALGWKPHGCDISAAAVERARRLLPDAQLRVATLEEARWPAGAFDAATLWHTLEHVPDALGTLRELARILRPGGRLVVGVPNIASAEAKLFGAHWRGLEIPRHLHHFTPETLRFAAEQAGFVVDEVRHQWKPSTFTESVDFKLNAWLRLGPRPHRKSVYYAAFVPAVASYLLGNHGCIELRARRRR